MSDGLTTMVGLFYGIAAGPSNAGNRQDGKICTAQPGECRFNSKYYSLGMRGKYGGLVVPAAPRKMLLTTAEDGRRLSGMQRKCEADGIAVVFGSSGVAYGE